MTSQLTILPPYRVGKWLPSDQTILVAWLEKKLVDVREAPDAPLHPVIQEFKDFIEGNADI